VAGRPDRARLHGEGALLRQVGLLLRRLSSARGAARSVRVEVHDLARRVEAASQSSVVAQGIEDAFYAVACRCWPDRGFGGRQGGAREPPIVNRV
jgi:hypothetical protein